MIVQCSMIPELVGAGLTEWHINNGERSGVFHTATDETILDEKNSVLIEHHSPEVYVITIGPMAHLTPVWRQWARWEAEV